MRALDEFDLDSKYKMLGRPQKAILPADVWKKGDLVLPIDEHAAQDLLEDKVYLGDFGTSIHLGSSVKVSGTQPTLYRAPEVLHSIESGFARDIWSYMFIFAELYLGVAIWCNDGAERLMALVVDLLGPLPQHWNGRYLYPQLSNESWYDQNRRPDPRVETIDQKITRFRPKVGAIERHHVLNVMALGFCYLPENRITAAELLQHHSFKALMDIYQT